MTAKDTVLIASFAALTAALGLLPPIPVPLIPVPVTAQTMGVMLAGCLLGPRRAGLAMALVLMLIAVGLPLLSGGRGGLAVFAGPSAGYLIAWPLGAGVIGFLTARKQTSAVRVFTANCVGGILVIYALGIPGLSLVMDLPLRVAAQGSLAFLPGDIAKAAIAAAVAVAVRRAYPDTGR